jgi:hypothetical protein
VIREVLEIFENPPYLHLGGDEMELAKPCFDELRAEMFDYNEFEGLLQVILSEVGYPEEQVIRWRETSFAPQSARNQTRLRAKKRAGVINHWWHDTPGKTENVTVGTPIIGSARLYMDVNFDEAAWEVFLHSRKWWHLNDIFAQNAPVNLKGIIVGGFELDPAFFHDRNVVGRLLAVSMGVSNLPILSGNQLNAKYAELCHDVKLPDALCRKYASPILDWESFKSKWGQVWREWTQDVCKRFPTAPKPARLDLPDHAPERVSGAITAGSAVQVVSKPSKQVPQRLNQTFDVLALKNKPNPQFPHDFLRSGPVIDILNNTSFNLTTLNALNL